MFTHRGVETRLATHWEGAGESGVVGGEGVGFDWLWGLWNLMIVEIEEIAASRDEIPIDRRVVGGVGAANPDGACALGESVGPRLGRSPVRELPLWTLPVDQPPDGAVGSPRRRLYLHEIAHTHCWGLVV